MNAVESSINRCRMAAEAAGHLAPVPNPDAAESVLRALEVAVHPRRLPNDLRTLVRCWDENSAANQLLFPGFFCDAEFVRSGLDEFSEWPRALVPIAYQSHCFLLMELDFDASTGPAIYSFEWAGEGIQLVARSLAAAFEWTAEQFVALSAGLLSDGIPELGYSMPRPTTGPDCGLIDYYQIATWPQRWQSEQGVTAAMYELKGATHTVAEFEAARRQGQVAATLIGEVKNLGGSGAGILCRLTDNTGAVEFFIPSEVPALEQSPNNHYEVDVVATPLHLPEASMNDYRPDHVEVQRLALSGEIDAAARSSVPLQKHLFKNHPVVATAQRAIRS